MISYRRPIHFTPPNVLNETLTNLSLYTQFENILVWVDELPKGVITVDDKFLHSIADKIIKVELDCAPRYILATDLELILKTIRARLRSYAEERTPSQFLTFLHMEMNIINAEIDKYRLLTSLKIKNWLGATLISKQNLTQLTEPNFDFLFGNRYDALIIEQKELRKEIWERIADIYKSEIHSYELDYFSISQLEGLGSKIEPKVLAEVTALFTDLGYVTTEAGQQKLGDSLRMLFGVDKRKFELAKNGHKKNKIKYGNILRTIEKLS